jgi:hypothetical protein
MPLHFETTAAKEDPRLEHLKTFAKKSTFFAGLLTQYENRGDLSPKQWGCIDREINAVVGMSDPALKPVLPALKEMWARFEGAAEHLKKPAILLCDEAGDTETRFQPAPAEGRNAGWIYVKRRGNTDWGWGWAYVAKVHPGTGELYVARGFEDRNQLVGEIKALLADGLDAAVLHFGHKTGACGCCGRELTQELSVKTGIGPVCAERFGIDRAALIQQ